MCANKKLSASFVDRYRVLEAHSVERMAGVLRVSRSGYYRWRTAAEGEREKQEVGAGRADTRHPEARTAQLWEPWSDESATTARISGGERIE